MEVIEFEVFKREHLAKELFAGTLAEFIKNNCVMDGDYRIVDVEGEIKGCDLVMRAIAEKV